MQVGDKLSDYCAELEQSLNKKQSVSLETFICAAICCGWRKSARKAEIYDLKL
jgi:hypothetical protein